MKNWILTLGFLVCFGLMACAQPSQGNPGGSPTPIDGGLGILLAAGAAFGAKKVYDARQK